MLPKEVLPAIPRRKVKNKHTGEIAGVLCYHDEDIYENVVIVLLENGNQADWKESECEPVPEEPRPFRVGDKVSLPSWYSNGTRYGIVTSILKNHGHDRVYSVDGQTMDEREEIFHATPEEIAKYFN